MSSCFKALILERLLADWVGAAKLAFEKERAADRFSKLAKT